MTIDDHYRKTYGGTAPAYRKSVSSGKFWADEYVSEKWFLQHGEQNYGNRHTTGNPSQARPSWNSRSKIVNDSFVLNKRTPWWDKPTYSAVETLLNPIRQFPVPYNPGTL